MHDLSDLIHRWENSALNFREVETLINLLIVDNRRLEFVRTNSTAAVIALMKVRELLESEIAAQPSVEADAEKQPCPHFEPEYFCKLEAGIKP